jgi:hypothetical protein
MISHAAAYFGSVWNSLHDQERRRELASSNHMSTYLSPHSSWLSACKNQRGKGDIFKAPLPGKVVESSALRTTGGNKKELGLPHTGLLTQIQIGTWTECRGIKYLGTYVRGEYLGEVDA